MAISLVAGGNLAGSAIDGGNVTITLPTLADGDVVYIAGGYTPMGVDPAISTSGYTQLALTANGPTMGVWRKKMGATPDASVTGTGNGSPFYAAAYALVCLRGVDGTTQEDATTGTATGSSSGPDSPSITTVTDGAWVLSFGLGDTADATITAPSGYGNQADANATDTVGSVTVGVATILKATAGAENPAAWTNWAPNFWIAASVAVRPSAAVGQPTMRRHGLSRTGLWHPRGVEGVNLF